MNKFKIFLVALLLPLMIAFAPAAQAASYWVHNANGSYEFWQGNDWGRLDADHNTISPRDNECDGRGVYFLIWLRADPLGVTYRYNDTNGCADGGGKYDIGRPGSRWNTIKFCEEAAGSDTCTPYLYLGP